MPIHKYRQAKTLSSNAGSKSKIQRNSIYTKYLKDGIIIETGVEWNKWIQIIFLNFLIMLRIVS